MNAAFLLAIAGFAAAAAVLVVATGNLGAAIGVHFGSNALLFLLVAHQDGLGALALFHGVRLEAIDWTGAEAVWFTLFAAVGNGATLLLLLDPRSPLRVEGDPS